MYKHTLVNLQLQLLDSMFSHHMNILFSQVLSSHGGVGLENLRVSVECQVAHRNALVAACQQNEVIVKKTVSLSKNTG